MMVSLRGWYLAAPTSRSTTLSYLLAVCYTLLCNVQNVREMMFEGCSFGFWLVGRMFEVFFFVLLFCSTILT